MDTHARADGFLRADKADTQAGRLRADRVLLRSPRPRGDGSVVFDAVLAYAEKPMAYSWGTEVATEEALSDPDYLAALKGLGLYTVKTAPHKNGVPISVRADAQAVGAILDARYDRDEKAVVLELVVNDRAALADIEAKRTTDLSEAYVPVTRVRADGVIEQVRRRPNHVAIVKSGRMPGAGLRADDTDHDNKESAMQLAALLAILGAYDLRADSESNLKADLDKLKSKADAETERADTEKQRADAAETALATMREGIGMNADSDDIEAALAAKIAEGMRADAELLSVARDLGVKLPEKSTPATRTRDIYTALGGDEQRADSEAEMLAYIHGARHARPTAAQRHSANARNTPNAVAYQRRLS